MPCNDLLLRRRWDLADASAVAVSQVGQGVVVERDDIGPPIVRPVHPPGARRDLSCERTPQVRTTGLREYGPEVGVGQLVRPRGTKRLAGSRRSRQGPRREALATLGETQSPKPPSGARRGPGGRKS